MSQSKKIPLTIRQLELAAHLCLRQAAFTDRDRFPPGSGDYACRVLHERKRRFEDAKNLLEKNTGTQVTELGLSNEDLTWAIKQAGRIRDADTWIRCFRATAEALKAAEEEQSAED